MNNEKKQYVWVFTAEQAWDGDVADTIVKVFPSERAATYYLHKFVYMDDGGEITIAEQAKRDGWIIDVDDPFLFRACADNDYANNHTECTVTKCEIEK